MQKAEFKSSSCPMRMLSSPGEGKCCPTPKARVQASIGVFIPSIWSASHAISEVGCLPRWDKPHCVTGRGDADLPFLNEAVVTGSGSRQAKGQVLMATFCFISLQISYTHTHANTDIQSNILIWLCRGRGNFGPKSRTCAHPGCLAMRSLSQLMGRHVIYSFTNVSPL